MARRRSRFSDAMAGLGEGLSNVSGLLLRTQMQDKLQARYDKRAAENAAAIATRQEQAEDRKMLDAALKELSEGADPASVALRLSARGMNVNPQQLEAGRPSPRRRMGKTSESIDTAKSLIDVPTDESIMGAGRREGLYDEDFSGPMPEGEESFAGFNQAVIDTGKQAGARRRTFRETPTEKITGTDPTGASFTQMVSPSMLDQPFATSPSAKQQGALAGEGKVAELGVSGSALASQAGREAGARTRADLQAQLATMGITGQQQTAALQLADDYAKQSTAFTETKNAVSNIATLAQRIEAERRAGKDSPASHIGMIFNFMKMQDPASTVREGEQAMAQNATGVDARVRNLYNSLLTGGRLSPEQVTDFATTAADIYRQRATAQKSLEEDFTKRAMGLRVPPQLVTGYISALSGGPQDAVDKLIGRQ